MVDENFIDSAAPTNAASPPPTTASSDTITASPPAEPTLDLAVMQQELSELKDTLAQYIRQSTPDIEQVRLALQSAEAERDNATGELKKLQRKNTLTALAEKNGFNDLEFLDFLLQKNNIAIDDSSNLEQFMQKLRQTHPRYFVLPIKSGSGSRPGNAIGNGYADSGLTRREAVEFLLAAAPEVL